MLVKMGKVPGKDHHPLWAFGAGEPETVPARSERERAKPHASRWAFFLTTAASRV